MTFFTFNLTLGAQIHNKIFPVLHVAIIIPYTNDYCRLKSLPLFFCHAFILSILSGKIDSKRVR